MAQLTSSLKAARALAELRALLERSAPQFNAIHDCAFCGRVAALAHDDADLARQLFAARASSWLQRPDGSSGKEGRNAANLLHSAAKVRPSAALVSALAHAAVRLAPTFNAQGAAISRWAVATLGVSDAGVVGPLAHAAVRVAASFNAQNAANSLWAVATLGVSDAGVVGPLAHAAVRLAPSFNAQDAANSLWAVATLGVSDAGGVGPLAHAAVRLAPSFNVLHVQQALQAHHVVPGGVFDAAVLTKLRARFVSAPSASSASQRRVAAVLKRLGHSPLEEAPLLGGLLTIDMRLERPGGEGGCPIALEFDGPFHFLRTLAPAPAGAASLVLDGATLLRDRLIASAGLALVSVPYTEWQEAERAGPAAEDAYLTRRLAEAAAPPASCAPSSMAAGPASAILPTTLCSVPMLGHPRYVSMHTLAASAPGGIGCTAAAAPAAWIRDRGRGSRDAPPPPRGANDAAAAAAAAAVSVGEGMGGGGRGAGSSHMRRGRRGRERSGGSSGASRSASRSRSHSRSRSPRRHHSRHRRRSGERRVGEPADSGGDAGRPGDGGSSDEERGHSRRRHGRHDRHRDHHRHHHGRQREQHSRSPRFHHRQPAGDDTRSGDGDREGAGPAHSGSGDHRHRHHHHRHSRGHGDHRRRRRDDSQSRSDGGRRAPSRHRSRGRSLGRSRTRERGAPADAARRDRSHRDTHGGGEKRR